MEGGLKKDLKSNDILLLGYCIEPKTIKEISKYLNIAFKNVTLKVEHLTNLKYLTTKKEGYRKPKIIQTKNSLPLIIDQLKVLKAIQYWEKNLLSPKVPCTIKKIQTTLDLLEIKLDFQLEPILRILQQNKRIGYVITTQGLNFIKQNQKLLKNGKKE